MRHGADPVDRYGGWSEYGLTEVGRSQVNSAKHKLLGKGITGIYSSDLNRAKETAEIVADVLSMVKQQSRLTVTTMTALLIAKKLK